MGKFFLILVAPIWLAEPPKVYDWRVWLLPMEELEQRFFDALDKIGCYDD